jgi:outer membrane murein-binding lipoprotein Lpp
VNIAVATVVAAVIAGAVGLFVMWRTNRAQYRMLAAEQGAKADTLGQLLIDQLQEERAAIKESLAKAHERLDQLAMRQRYWEDYVNALRQHIEEKLPPPPPAYPTALLRID